MRAGEVYENRVQGDRFVVREGSEDTAGERLVGDLHIRPGGAVAGKHVHAYITERFEVLAGSVRFHIDGREEVVGAGQKVEVPPGVVHDWWNIGDEAQVLVDIRPAERFELMIQNLYGLANDGKTDARGVPKLLPLALFAREFRAEGEFVRPPRIVQRILFAALAPLARARGYRAISPEYLGPTGKAAGRVEVTGGPA
ncbi:MAG TPA: cupin domain-containing protein [Solirubrobacterales bacterium]|nr:cupin domain-containing protein [Solirubrobacterales bacterium]